MDLGCDLAASSLSSDNSETATPGNRMQLLDNDDPGTTVGCAQYAVGTFALTDDNNTSSDEWKACVDGAEVFDFADGVETGDVPGGDLGGTYAVPTVTDMTLASEAQGDLAMRGASNWAVVADSTTAGECWLSGGAGSDPGYATCPSASGGDVGGVGDCIDGDCLDGSSDGGTYIRIYDGNSSYGELQVPDIAGNRTFTLPLLTATLARVEGQTWSGGHDFGAATSLELPNSATPATSVTGHFALDTTITDHQPLWQYYDGAKNMTVIAVDTAELPALDAEIIKYDAATDKYYHGPDNTAASALNDITDVVITAPGTGAILKYDGANWIDGSIDLADADAVGSSVLAAANIDTAMATDTEAAAAVTYENLSTNFDIGFGATQVPRGSLTAPLDGAALTGSVTVPTKSAEDNSIAPASTAYVQTELAQVDTCTELSGCVPSAITSTGVTYENLSTNSDIGFGPSQVPAGNLTAALAAPTFTGDAKAVTASGNDGDTSIATTLFVQGEINGSGGNYLACASGSCDVDVEVITDVATMNLDSPVTDDSSDFDFSCSGTNGCAITKVWCSTDTGTATINFEERVETTPNTAGVDVLSAGLVCDTGSQSSCASGCDVDTISNGGIDQYDPINLQVDAVASTPGVVRIHVQYTRSDS